MEQAAVGRIVLCKTADGDRPMLIVRVQNENTVNGILFLDGWNDKNLGSGGMTSGWQVWVTSVQRGNEVGQWRFYND